MAAPMPEAPPVTIALAPLMSMTSDVTPAPATVTNPTNGLQLDNVLSRNSCYLCHPGSTTRCLRGAMGGAVNASDGSLVMQCQSCHGQMSDVGSVARTGWLMEPNCQACHSGDAEANAHLARPLRGEWKLSV